MNGDLDKLLKSARVPERSPGYWENFPHRVTARLSGGERPARQSSPAWGWTAGGAAAGVVLALGVAFWLNVRSEHREQAAQQKYVTLYREIAALFPHQVEAIVADEHGVRVVLADRPDVPTSPPLWLNVCGPRHCRDIITFSGQEVRVNGDLLEVLTDAHDNVLVVGSRMLWSSKEPTRVTGAYRIAVRRLEAAS